MYIHTLLTIDRRNTMILGLQEIDKLRSPLQDIQIPLEVFELVC